jgi:dihydroorotase
MGIPNAAEDTMVSRDISLAELTGGRLHIAHISTRDAVEMVRRAKARGLRVTAEVTPHHLTLTDDAVKGYDTNAKMNPPLRGEHDREAVIQGLKDGTIDCVATDHAPHSTIEKDIEFDRAANGVVGLETALPLVLRLVEKDILTLSQAIERMTADPARVLGLEKGTLQVGADADITIIDTAREWVVEADRFYSKSRNTPFDGWKMKGRAVKTIVGGRVVYSEK